MARVSATGNPLVTNPRLTFPSLTTRQVGPSWPQVGPIWLQLAPVAQKLSQVGPNWCNLISGRPSRQRGHFFGIGFRCLEGPKTFQKQHPEPPKAIPNLRKAGSGASDEKWPPQPAVWPLLWYSFWSQDVPSWPQAGPSWHHVGPSWRKLAPR